MRAGLVLVALAALAAAARAEVPPELRGRVSAEVTSCEPFQAGADTRVVLVRVRAGANGVKKPEIRCGAAPPGSDQVLAWTRVAGLDQVAADEVREAMVLVPADSAHSECRCAVAGFDASARCAPWEAMQAGRCVEPGDVAAPPPPAASDELSGALRVSRALTPLRALVEPGRTTEGDTGAICASVPPAELSALVFALVPEDETVYVRPLWHQLDARDRRAFAIWASECFGVARIVDTERGAEVRQPPSER